MNLKNGKEIIKSNNKINIKHMYYINILFICTQQEIKITFNLYET